MAPLSMDLRERIVKAYSNKEGSYTVIAKRFDVSPDTVAKLVRQLRKLGTLQPQLHRRGRKPAIDGEKKEELRRHLEEHPDATVLERREALGLTCTGKTIWQTLRKMGWRYKKKRSERQNRIARTLH